MVGRSVGWLVGRLVGGSGACVRLLTRFVMLQEPPTPWLWYGAMLLAGGGLGSIWVNRETLFRVKHKRF